MPLFTSVLIIGGKVVLGKMGLGHGLLLLGKKKIIHSVGKAAYRRMVEENFNDGAKNFSQDVWGEIKSNIDGVKDEGLNHLVKDLKINDSSNQSTEPFNKLMDSECRPSMSYEDFLG